MASTILPPHSPLTLSTIVLLLLLLLYSLTSLAASGNCFSDDKNALLAIKNSFRKPDILANWTDDTTCCDWTGIQCLSSTSRVVSIRISSSSTLFGSIPTAIADVPFLTTLIFSDLPGLTGSIPSSLSLLPHLSTLILTNTSLSGPIPSSLYLLNSLQLLRLSHNLLSGRIPKSFGRFNASSPPQLDLSNNLLVGNIPADLGEIDWGFIDLSNNQLDGDASMLFGAAKKTTRMNLSSNRFRFDLSRVSFPVNLGVLYLNRNKINGSIPAQINQLSHLIVMNLSDNKLCGEIPAGTVTSKFGKEAYAGNKCLCGASLGTCPASG